jgi:hypothetical protein
MFHEALLVTRAGEDESFLAILQRNQAHGRIREQRQQLGIGETSDGSRRRLRGYRPARGSTWNQIWTGKRGQGEKRHHRQTPERQPPPASAPEDASASQQGNLATRVALPIE